jgi:translation initiation factor IF-2
MRVFELARSLKTTSADVLKIVAALEIEASTALSRLEADDIAAVRAKLATAPDAAAAASRAERLEAKRQANAVKRAACDRVEADALAAAIVRSQATEAEVRGLPPPQQPVPQAAVQPEALIVLAAQPPPAAAPAPATPPPVAPTPVQPAPAAAPAAKPAAHPAKQKSTPPPASAEEQIDPDEEVAATWNARQPPRTAAKPPPAKPSQNDRDRGDQARRQPPPPRQPPTRAAAPPPPPLRRPGAAAPAPVEVERVIQLRGATIVKDLAELIGLRPNRVIADLMHLNVLASINQRVELDVATKIAEKYGYKVEIERQKRSTERKPILRRDDADDVIPDDKPEDLVPRPPVVTFLGHVDHGKTSLMDRIRNTQVASGEAGGITQHIGAYTVDVNGRRITFLDTPGHAAFSAMRARGASLTDIAVIIIAADDGVMPQTKEAIKHAKQAGVQILVAINKCDLPQAKPELIRQQLSGEGLTPEEWGGDIVCCEVSALTGKGLDHLLEMILIQADVLELTASLSRRADGYVIEAQLEQGRGPTASVLVSGGILRVGDILLCGEYFGRIRGLIDDRGRLVKEATPGTAARIMGLSGVPEAGAHFRVMLNEKRARELAEKESEVRKLSELSSSVATSLDTLMQKYQEQGQLEIHVIIKADMQGSCEAIQESLNGIKSAKVALQIVNSGIGHINANDVQRAASGRAIIVGFHVGCEPGVQSLARHDGVRISTHRIIYELIDHVKQEMLNMLHPEYKEILRGHAEIRAIFNHGKRGMIAGCQMLDGVLRMDSRARVLRQTQVVFDGKFLSLFHFQDEVARVDGSQECGVRFVDFAAFAVGDVIECYSLEEKERVL